MPNSSVENIRSHFPALARQHNGYTVAYFDGPGGTQVPRQVVAAMGDYLLHHNANEGWAYPSSVETDELLAGARQAMADMLNADSEEIVFGQNMTSLTFHISRALGRQFVPGDELIVTELDHHANVDPWKQLAQDRGLTVRVAQMDIETGELDWAHFESLVNRRTKVIAVGASSNALGTINDVRRATRLARDVGAYSFVDAVHYAPHQLVDVKDFGCDFLACSAYKFYGPHTGVLYARGDLLQSLDVPKLEPAPESAPERFETGTQSFESICGTAAAVEFLASLGAGATRREKLSACYAGLHQHSAALFRQLWDGLVKNPLVRVYGLPPGENRSPTVSFTVEGFTARQISERLAERGVFASHGNFYALTAARRLGQEENGLVRAGLACYTTEEEVHRLLAACPGA